MSKGMLSCWGAIIQVTIHSILDKSVTSAIINMEMDLFTNVF